MKTIIAALAWLPLLASGELVNYAGRLSVMVEPEGAQGYSFVYRGDISSLPMRLQARFELEKALAQAHWCLDGYTVSYRETETGMISIYGECR